VRGEQEIIVRYEPERALATLPDLLTRREDREKLATLFRRLFADERVRKARPTAEELAIVERIGESLGAKATQRPRKAVARRTSVPAAKKRAARKQA
jgi:hypothetical protein